VTTRCRTTLDLVFSDFVNDLALLRSATPLSSAAVFREGQAVAMGEQVMTVGYPLAGLLGTTPSVTVGNVSSLVAVGDDTRGLRFTAPIQKGNSGGPLLDASGLVVGTVASKLAADRLHEMTGDLPENVNFALKGAMVRSFLEATGITYATSPPRADRGAAAVAQDACGFVYRILCR
jgi:S1-C subfamily serine protease